MEVDSPAPHVRDHDSPPRVQGDGLPYRHPLRAAPGAPIRSFVQPHSPPRHYDSGREYDYSESESARSDGDNEDGRDMDVDDDIDGMLSDEGEDQDRADGDGDGEGGDGQPEGTTRRKGRKERPEIRECQWEDCELVHDTQDDLVQHVHNGGSTTVNPLTCSAHWDWTRPVRMPLAVMPPSGPKTSQQACAPDAHSLAYWREAVYLSTGRCVCFHHF